MNIIENFITRDVYELTIFITIILLIFISLYSIIRIHKLSNKYNRFIKSFEGTNIEKELEKFMIKVDEVSNKNLEIKNHCNQIERTLIKCFQKVGVVRYSAFEDVGSDLSFVIALLDANDDGFIINGVYSRDSSTTYAKPVLKGKSKHALSAEETQALDIARKAVNE